MKRNFYTFSPYKTDKFSSFSQRKRNNSESKKKKRNVISKFAKLEELVKEDFRLGQWITIDRYMDNSVPKYVCQIDGCINPRSYCRFTGNNQLQLKAFKEL